MQANYSVLPLPQLMEVGMANVRGVKVFFVRIWRWRMIASIKPTIYSPLHSGIA